MSGNWGYHALVAALWLALSSCQGTIHRQDGAGPDDHGSGSGGGGSDHEQGGRGGAGSGSGGDGTGVANAGEGGDIDGTHGPFHCNTALSPPEQPLRRLSNAQYQARLRALVLAIAPVEGAAILGDLDDRLAALPRDLRSGPDPDYAGLRRLDQSIYAEMIDGSYEVGSALGTGLTGSTARLRAVAGDCAIDTDTTNDAACVDAFIRSLGEHAFGREVSDEDVAFYREAVQGDPVVAADYADIVTQIVAAPSFLYAVELGIEGDEPGDAVPLTGHELASRLAFHFWQAAPDRELLDAAQAGDLNDDALYARQVERVYADPRTATTIEELFVDWLQPKHLHELDRYIGSPDYDALRGGFTPSADLKEAMLAELGRVGSYYGHEVEASFDELFLSNLSLAQGDELADIYGVDAWTGGAPPTFPQVERRGLLTRAALVATGAATSHPIFKGVYARKVILCDDIPPPPADAMTIANTVEPDGITSRALTEALSMARADCQGCHTQFINPIGFALERFDGLGRYRDVERVFDPQTGELIGEVDVDSSSSPRIVPGDDRVVSGAPELHEAMLDSEKPQACFARHYFRFTFARIEDDERDGCALASIYEDLIAGRDVASVLRGIALRPEFRTKSYDP